MPSSKKLLTFAKGVFYCRLYALQGDTKKLKIGTTGKC